MPRWLWFAPLVGLTAVLAVGVFRLGWFAAELTETDVIMIATEQYQLDAVAAGHTPRRDTDCIASPGKAPVWITVTCVTEGHRYSYAMDRAGRFLNRPVDRPTT